MSSRSVTVQDAVGMLNRALAADRPAIAALIANRMPCNEALADDPTIQVGRQHGGFNVGMLGILNGLFGVDGAGWGSIAGVFEDSPTDPKGPRDLVRFEVMEVKITNSAAAGTPKGIGE